MLLSAVPATDWSVAFQSIYLPARLHRSANDSGTESGGSNLAGSGATYPLSAVPVLHSDPGAPAEVYLDFTGAPAQTWGSYQVPATPAYDVDGDPSTFSDAELARIHEIWARVAEKFSPFNLDITTQDPGLYAPGHALRVVIGGDGAWDIANSGGVSYVGGFAQGPATVWVFSKNLTDGDAHYTAEAIAHESGHAFGLQHQSVWGPSGLLNVYNPGDAATAPIMGRSYSAARGLWWRGPDPNSPTETQDDLAIIASPGNGFGYRPQDHGQTLATADAVTVTGNTFNETGVIETTSDTDFFTFTTGAGNVALEADVAPLGPTLDLKVLLFDAKGTLVAAADTQSLGERLSENLPAGTYYVCIASHGGYGDVGQYALSGQIVPPMPAPVPTPPPNPTPQPLNNPASTAPSGATNPPAPVSVTPPVVSPSFAPTDLAASIDAKSRVDFAWTIPAGTSPRYVVERSTNGRAWKHLGLTAPGADRYVDAHPSRSQAEYRVALIGTRDGIVSNIVTLPATLPPTNPSATSHADKSGKATASKSNSGSSDASSSAAIYRVEFPIMGI